MADTFDSDLNSNKLYLHSGQLTTTIKNSIDVNAVDSTPADISPTSDGDTLWCGAGAQKLYLTSGQFSSTLKNSIAVGGGEGAQYGVTWEIDDSSEIGNSLNKLRLRSGIFTTTIKTSLDITAQANVTLGMSSSSEDTFIANATTPKKFMIFSGKYTSTVKVSTTGPLTTQNWGIGATGSDTLGCHRSAGQKLYLFSGQITTTIKDSQTSPNIVPSGIETADFNARFGITGAEPTLVTAISRRQLMIYPNGTVIKGTLESADHSTVAVMTWEDINGNTYTPAVGDRIIIFDVSITNNTGTNVVTLFQDHDKDNTNDAGEMVIEAEFSGAGTWSQSYTHPIALEKLTTPATNDLHVVSSAAGATAIMVNAHVLQR